MRKLRITKVLFVPPVPTKTVKFILGEKEERGEGKHPIVIRSLRLHIESRRNSDAQENDCGTETGSRAGAGVVTHTNPQPHPLHSAAHRLLAAKQRLADSAAGSKRELTP